MWLTDRLDPRALLSGADRTRLQASDLTPDQHERLLVLAVAGGSERVLTQRRLEFSRELADRGRIGEDDRG